MSVRFVTAASMFLSMFLSAVSWAVAAGGPLKFPAADVKEIRVVGVKGNVVLSNEPLRQASVSLQGPLSDWGPVALLAGGVLEIRVKGSSERAEWSANIPSAVVEYRGPAVPALVVWKEGSVKVSGWDKTSRITLHKGTVSVDGMKAGLNIFTQEGEINVTGMEGGIEVETRDATTKFTKIMGPMKISSYGGKFTATDLDGSLTLISHTGKNAISKSKGNLDFKGGQGEITIESYTGPINARMDQGSLAADLAGALDVRIHTGSGRVTLNVPRSSGARVDLGTGEGTFYVAPQLQQDRTDTMKFLRGRLAGNQEGSVYVRTDTGDIRLKTF